MPPVMCGVMDISDEEEWGSCLETHDCLGVPVYSHNDFNYDLDYWIIQGIYPGTFELVAVPANNNLQFEQKGLLRILCNVNEPDMSSRLVFWAGKNRQNQRGKGMFVRPPTDEEKHKFSVWPFRQQKNDDGTKAVLYTSVVVPNRQDLNGAVWVKRYCMKVCTHTRARCRPPVN